MPHVLVAGRIHDAGLALLRSASGVTFDLVEEVSTESYSPLVEHADAVLIRTQPMPAAVINAAPRLKIVSRHGVGFPGSCGTGRAFAHVRAARGRRGSLRPFGRAV